MGARNDAISDDIDRNLGFFEKYRINQYQSSMSVVGNHQNVISNPMALHYVLRGIENRVGKEVRVVIEAALKRQTRLSKKSHLKWGLGDNSLFEQQAIDQLESGLLPLRPRFYPSKDSIRTELEGLFALSEGITPSGKNSVVLRYAFENLKEMYLPIYGQGLSETPDGVIFDPQMEEFVVAIADLSFFDQLKDYIDQLRNQRIDEYLEQKSEFDTQIEELEEQKADIFQQLRPELLDEEYVEHLNSGETDAVDRFLDGDTVPTGKTGMVIQGSDFAQNARNLGANHPRSIVRINGGAVLARDCPQKEPVSR